MNAMVEEMRREISARVGALLVVLSAASSGLCAACNDSGTPSGKGDTVVDDTRDAEARPPANPTPDDGGDNLGEPDATFYEGGTGASYPGVTACSTCSCTAPSGYCFGGATARLSMFRPEATDAGSGDAGLAACPIQSGATPAIGCNAPPAGCTDCPCILTALQPSYGCYLVCATVGSSLTVYCPSP